MPHVEYKTVHIDKLIPADYNPRKISPHALKGLQKSIEKFGLVEPIVINKRTGNMVAGHQRLKVLRKKKIQKCHVAVIDIDLAEEKALNISLNNPHITGEFTEGLGDILTDIGVELPDLISDLNFDALVHISEINSENIIEKELPNNLEISNKCPNCNYEW